MIQIQGEHMNATEPTNAAQRLHQLGQSLWLDNITRGLLDRGTLKHYIETLAVTGLTSNPTIFDQAIGNAADYDKAIREKTRQGMDAEKLFFDLAVEDLQRAADLFLPAHRASGGVDGWVSLEVSPLLVDDTAGTLKEAIRLSQLARRPNLFIKIPGTPAGVPAIEEAIFAGIPINVTLLFSREQYLAAAHAYLRGIERRIKDGKDPKVSSVASLFVSRWDVLIAEKAPAELRNRYGIAIGKSVYQAYRELLESERFKKLQKSGALPQRLLWASTGTKDPSLPATYYVDALAAPQTINTIPEKTLLALAQDRPMVQALDEVKDNGAALIQEFTRAGFDQSRIGMTLQEQGAAAFKKSWADLLQRITSKGRALEGASARSPS